MRDTVAEVAAAGARAPAISESIAGVEQRLEDLRRELRLGIGRHEWAQLPEAFLDRLPELETAVGDLAAQLDGLGAGAGPANCARRATALAASLATFRDLSDESGLRWVEIHQSGLSLQYTPFEIAERLRAYVEARPCAWVFTSATLAIAEDFSHFAARIGLPEARTLRIDSPFDYKTQARIYLPANMPEPQHPSFASRFIEACAPLLEASGGRAFLLYTSYRGLADGGAGPTPGFSQPPV